MLKIKEAQGAQLTDQKRETIIGIRETHSFTSTSVLLFSAIEFEFLEGPMINLALNLGKHASTLYLKYTNTYEINYLKLMLPLI